MAEETRLGKVSGTDDKYVFITMDLSKGQMVRTSSGLTEQEARQRLKEQNLSDVQIEAEFANARANEV